MTEPKKFVSRNVLTVSELKSIIKDWPETDPDGNPCEVWIDSADGSNQAFSVWPLNSRAEYNYGDDKFWADILICPRAKKDGRNRCWTRVPNMENDIVLEMAIKKLSKAFDEFIGSCLDADGKPKAPDYKAMMKARGYLPPYCSHALARSVLEKP